jgi:putative DNA primase/helicase
VGYVFSEDCPHAGVDLDKCRDPDTGELRYCARVLLEHLNSYSEISPSETGVHSISKAKWPSTGNQKTMPCGMKIEVYDRLRYFTMTGAHLEDNPLTIESRQEHVTALHRAVFTKADDTTKPGPSPTLELSDQELIDKARQAANEEKFWKLLKGNWQGDYASESEATAALLNHLAFWLNRDPGRMD